MPWNRSLIPGQLAVASILDKVGPNRNSEFAEFAVEIMGI